jgi:nucleoside-diphosphate-sugar epimerase
MTQTYRALVTGAGGFIGHHLVKRLRAEGHWVRGVDLKQPEYEPSRAHEFLQRDLREWTSCLDATSGIDCVYHLAADMGGIGYITSSHAAIARNNVLMDAHVLEASHRSGVERLLYSSTACVYPQALQAATAAVLLKEEDAWPADPEPGYGLEKLYVEKLCEYYRMDHGLATRVVRFHNVYGPLGTYSGGKEKSPAALCRKIALANDGDEIEVWGDGEQTRSYMYVDDCVEGLLRVMASSYDHPLNLGTDRGVSINTLVDIIARVAGKTIRKRHDPSKPQGVRGRNSDNQRIERVLGWSPSTTLEEGLAVTYRWIERQCRAVQADDARLHETRAHAS